MPYFFSSTPGNDEKLVRIVRQHWIKYVFLIFVYLVLLSLSVGMFVAAGVTAYHTQWVSFVLFTAALVLFLFAHHWFFVTLLCEMAVHIAITNHRVVWVRDKLFLDEHMTEYAFTIMETVEARKHGLLQTILRYGTLQFETGPDITLVPHPISVAKDIEQAMGMR